MSARLHTLLSEAESLPEDEQDALADVIESFLASQDGSGLFTAEEMQELKRLDAEPFDPASPEEVAAFLAGRG